MRTQVESSSLTTAVAWERLRHIYLSQVGRDAEADHARKWANYYIDRLEDVAGVETERVQ